MLRLRLLWKDEMSLSCGKVVVAQAPTATVNRRSWPFATRRDCTALGVSEEMNEVKSRTHILGLIYNEMQRE